MVGSFETGLGMKVSFCGFYKNMNEGVLISSDSDERTANKAADAFVKKAYASIAPITLYSRAMNSIMVLPFIALMPMVAALLAYSILRLKGACGSLSFGGAFKIVGSYAWFSGVIAAVATVMGAFFTPPKLLTVLPILVFFITLLVRSAIFTAREIKSNIKQSEQTEQTEA